MDSGNKEILLSYSQIGQSLEEYFGPVRKKFFASNIKTLTLEPNVVEGFNNLNENGKSVFLKQFKLADSHLVKEDNSLAFIIDTHNRPYSDQLNPQPSIDLVDNLKKLFSENKDEKKEYILEILTSRLAAIRTDAKDYKNILDKVHKIDPESHPGVKISVASSFAREANRQEYKSIKDLFKTLNKNEYEYLYPIYKTLNKSNEGINIVTDHSGHSLVAIMGENIDIAVEKLIAGTSLIKAGHDTEVLSDELKKGLVKTPEFKTTSRKVLKLLDKSSRYREATPPKMNI